MNPWTAGPNDSRALRRICSQCGFPPPPELARAVAPEDACAGAETLIAGAPPENPRPPTSPPRLNPAFARENTIGAGRCGSDDALGIAFTACKFSRIGTAGSLESSVGMPAWPRRLALFTARETRRAATFDAVGANILRAPPFVATLASNIVETLPFSSGSAATNAAFLPSASDANSLIDPCPNRLVVNSRRGGIGNFFPGGTPFFSCPAPDKTGLPPANIICAPPIHAPGNPPHPPAISSNINPDGSPNPIGHHPT